MHTVAILALPGVQLLDVSGPLDVFAEANVQAGTPAYRMMVGACAPGPLVSSSGLRLMPDFVVGPDTEIQIDTLLVAGCPNIDEISLTEATLAWLRCTAMASHRFGSVCSGAFALAAAGLLDGVRITTHWAVADALRQAFPEVTVDDDAIHVRDDKVRTAAGVTSGLDLALALVEEDLTRDIAMRVASQLVMFFKRPGGQLQFIRKGEAAPIGRLALQEVQRWVATNPDLDHSVSKLAKRIDVSPRHFSRIFHAEVGMTPAAWIEVARVEAARRMLEDGHGTPKQVAALCGFANVDVLRRAFRRRVGVTPAEYRRRNGKVDIDRADSASAL